jgi:hypothetical protein
MTDSTIWISFENIAIPPHFFLNLLLRFDSSNFIDNIGSFLYYNVIIGMLLIMTGIGYLISYAFP